MKHFITFIACLACLQLFACNKDAESLANESDTLIIAGMKITITVGSSSFTATLYNNATANAFRSKLPLNIDMKELNGNEKYYDFPERLPANASNPGTIQSGDLMLYGSNTLVLFYKSFRTSYNYTKIALIPDAAGLANALGSGDKTVKIELQ